MFDQILNVVKEQLSKDPQTASAIPADKANAVHQEVASHIEQGLKGQVSAQGGIGGLLSSLTGAGGSKNPVSGTIEGGLASALGSKFGLSPAITAAIAGALPGILQKFATKAGDPNDKSISLESITKSLGGSGLPGGLGNILGKF